MTLDSTRSPKATLLPQQNKSADMDAAKAAVDSVADGVKKVALDAQKKPDKKEKKKKSGDGGVDESGPLELNPPPEFIDHRIKIFEKLKAKYDAEVAAKPREPITITMQDGSIKLGTSWETTPAQIAKEISSSLLKRTVIARLNGDNNQLWDLERPLEQSCSLELLPFEHEEGKKVFWHSSAHILGECSERRFGCNLCFGPPIEDGFYYEMALPGAAAVQQSDWKPLETLFGKIVKEKQKFERLVISKEDLLEMFKTNPYKQHVINEKVTTPTTTVYRNGPLIDLCRGPHVPNTGKIETFAIMKNSASYFLGDPKRDSLQRIYGVSFPDKKQMAEHKKFLEEAAKRDHRKIGRDQELFFFHEMSPGSAMWLPHGARIYNTVQNFLREEYWNRGYEEVITPNMYNSELWKASGHWQNYKDDMFTFEVDKDQFGLKPMNCPGHCLMFSHRERSHRELPWRVADFGVLHRNEASGALTGLSRVRRFQQDDAHIFCREDQIVEEMEGLFDFLRTLYGLLGFTFKMKLSTRNPEKYVGELAEWERAEESLKTALDKFTAATGAEPWQYNPADAAFYGPKIDIKVSDSMRREWQCATIQLDFQLPQRFGLEYMTAEGAVKAKDEEVKEVKKVDAQEPVGEAAEKESKKDKAKTLTPGCARPVMIHRAMAGSIERFVGVLCEHFGGKWPFWLSPRQILVIPVGVGFFDYAREVQGIFHKLHMFVDVDLSGNTLPKKIRTGQLAQYNFIFGKLWADARIVENEMLIFLM